MSQLPQFLGFLAIFVAFWLYVTHTLAQKSGWYSLMRRYPNPDEQAILKLRFQWGWLGDVSMSSILRLEACTTGLRVGILKMFGPFCRDFFVPWSEIKIERTRRQFWKVADLSFGDSGVTLTLPDYIANRLARAASNHWPESGTFLPDTELTALRIAFTHWLIGMAVIVGFFTLAPALMTGKLGTVPLEIPEIFGAMLGLFALREFLMRTRE